MNKERLEERRQLHQDRIDEIKARLTEIPQEVERLKYEAVQREGSIIEIDAQLKELENEAQQS